MYLDIRNDFDPRLPDNNTASQLQEESGGSASLLLNVCIAFAVVETLLVIAFILSWHFNRENNSSNTKGVYALILLGYAFCFGGVVIGILKVTIGGAGHPAHTVSRKTIRRMLQLVKAHEVVYVVSIPFPKLAILCLYLRLFTARLSKAILYATAFTVIATALFFFIASFANCRPFNAFWNQSIQATCTMDVMTAFRYYSVPNIATDVVILILPIPALLRLNVGTLAKVGVAFTFLMCTLGIVTAVMRFVSFMNVDSFADITYNSISTTSWSIIEPGVYLMAATVPTLQPLVRRLFRRYAPRPLSRHTNHTRGPNTSGKATLPDTPIERPRLTKKQSEKEMLATIGRAPSRMLRLDDYHHLHLGLGLDSRQSEDDDSMVCADAIIHESMGRQGRNPDGTLQLWSLQPIVVSPLRTSFPFDD